MFEGEKYVFLLYITFWDAGAWFNRRGRSCLNITSGWNSALSGDLGKFWEENIYLIKEEMVNIIYWQFNYLLYGHAQ